MNNLIHFLNPLENKLGDCFQNIIHFLIDEKLKCVSDVINELRKESRSKMTSKSKAFCNFFIDCRFSSGCLFEELLPTLRKANSKFTLTYIKNGFKTKIYPVKNPYDFDYQIVLSGDSIHFSDTIYPDFLLKEHSDIIHSKDIKYWELINLISVVASQLYDGSTLNNKTIYYSKSLSRTAKESLFRSVHYTTKELNLPCPKGRFDKKKRYDNQERTFLELTKIAISKYKDKSEIQKIAVIEPIKDLRLDKLAKQRRIEASNEFEKVNDKLKQFFQWKTLLMSIQTHGQRACLEREKNRKEEYKLKTQSLKSKMDLDYRLLKVPYSPDHLRLLHQLNISEETCFKMIIGEIPVSLFKNCGISISKSSYKKTYGKRVEDLEFFILELMMKYKEKGKESILRTPPVSPRSKVDTKAVDFYAFHNVKAVNDDIPKELNDEWVKCRKTKNAQKFVVNNGKTRIYNLNKSLFIYKDLNFKLVKSGKIHENGIKVQKNDIYNLKKSNKKISQKITDISVITDKTFNELIEEQIKKDKHLKINESKEDFISQMEMKINTLKIYKRLTFKNNLKTTPNFFKILISFEDAERFKYDKIFGKRSLLNKMIEFL